MPVPSLNLLISFLSPLAGPLIATYVADQPVAAEMIVVHEAGAPFSVKLALPARAVTACTQDRLSAPSVACAIGCNELPATRKDDSVARRMAWIGSIVFGILAAVGAVWLYRKINPELLTPPRLTEQLSPVEPHPNDGQSPTGGFAGGASSPSRAPPYM